MKDLIAELELFFDPKNRWYHARLSSQDDLKTIHQDDNIEAITSKNTLSLTSNQSLKLFSDTTNEYSSCGSSPQMVKRLLINMTSTTNYNIIVDNEPSSLRLYTPNSKPSHDIYEVLVIQLKDGKVIQTLLKDQHCNLWKKDVQDLILNSSPDYSKGIELNEYISMLTSVIEKSKDNA